MRVINVDKNHIKQFVDFPQKLYADDDKYVPYMLADLTKTLKRLILKDKTYRALLVTEKDEVLARVLFTVDKNKQLNTEKCGFFCMFECIDSQKACNLMLDEMVRQMRDMGADYVSGTYFPFDQDNRRGILYQGFDRAPLIFTSHNPAYYNDLLVNYGMEKQTDALEYELKRNYVDDARLQRIAEFSQKKYDYRVETIDWKHLDRDIADFYSVMQQATNEIIYQDAPTMQALYNIVAQWKNYLNKDFILVARLNSDNTPIGIAMALPDFFQVFRKMRGKTDLKGILAFLKERKKINSIRAIMQYVVPAYQHTGAIVSLYRKMISSCDKNGITYAELGTIMENNAQSNGAIKALGGKLARVYRIYYRKI